MKHFKKIALLLMAAVFLTMLPSVNTLKVYAAEPTKHFIVFDEDTAEWEWYIGDSTVEEAEIADPRGLSYLSRTFKDGDILVIYGNASYEQRLELDLSDYRISNLTVTQNSDGVVIKAGSIDKCYLLDSSSSSITGFITNANVYDKAAVTFCSDIDTLHVISTSKGLSSTIGCQGTVNHVIAEDAYEVHYEYYSVARDYLNMEEGSWDPEEGYYSTTPTAQVASNAANTANTANTSDAYDKVPKTGDNSSIALLFVIAAICCAGGITALKKTSH